MLFTIRLILSVERGFFSSVILTRIIWKDTNNQNGWRVIWWMAKKRFNLSFEIQQSMLLVKQLLNCNASFILWFFRAWCPYFCFFQKKLYQIFIHYLRERCKAMLNCIFAQFWIKLGCNQVYKVLSPSFFNVLKILCSANGPEHHIPEFLRCSSTESNQLYYSIEFIEIVDWLQQIRTYGVRNSKCRSSKTMLYRKLFSYHCGNLF